MPTDLIKVWEDYSFMLYCQSGWTIIAELTAPGKYTEIRATEEDWDNAYQILSLAITHSDSSGNDPHSAS
jgi:hypothetical protein